MTGGSGFVGRHLVAALLARGHTVRAAQRRVFACRASGAVETVPLPDLRGPADWPALIDGVGAVVHLAACSEGTGAADLFRVNAHATGALALAARRAGIRMVHLSSVRAQCGRSAPHILDEEGEPAPQDAYGHSKLLSERLVRDSGADAVILRPVAVHGRGAGGALGRLARLARSPLPLPLAGATAPRSILSVGNLCAGILHCLSRPGPGTFLIADPAPLCLPQMVAAMRRGLGRGPGLFAVPRTMLPDRLRSGLVVDAAKLRADGWREIENSEAALARMMGPAGEETLCAAS